MLVGVISDSHDNLPNIKRAVARFNERKVSLVLHAGDLIAPFALEPLEALQAPYLGVFGNNDGERVGLGQKSKGRLRAGPLIKEVGGKVLALAHSEFEIPDGKYDLVITGHTHRARVLKKWGTLYLNPGEAGGWRYGLSTIAIVDLDPLSAEIIEL